jgi:hypothetical protein
LGLNSFFLLSRLTFLPESLIGHVYVLTEIVTTIK